MPFVAGRCARCRGSAQGWGSTPPPPREEPTQVSNPSPGEGPIKLITCPDCGHQVSRIAKACPNCGNTALTQTMLYIKIAEKVLYLFLILAILKACHPLFFA